MYDAFIAHYYKERLGYLDLIVSSLREQTLPPRDIYIWNNSQMEISVTGAKIVQSPANFGPIAKHVFALLSDAEWFLFQDDDLVLASDSAQKIALKLPSGLFAGSIGKDLTDTDSPYSDARHIEGVEQSVDVIVGRWSACTRQRIVDAIRIREMHRNLDWFNSDDLLLSFAGSRNNIVIPVKFTSLDEYGHGLSFDPNHYTNRDKICHALR